MITRTVKPLADFRTDWIYSSDEEHLHKTGSVYISAYKNGLPICDKLVIDCAELIQCSRTFNEAILELCESIQTLSANYISNIELNSFDSCLAAFVDKESHQDIKNGIDGFIRFGHVYARFPSEYNISISVGTDNSPKARIICKALFETMNESSCLRWPRVLFDVKETINKEPNTSNYDLFCLACQTTVKTGFPIYRNADNKPYLTNKRSIISTYVINLVKLALASHSISEFKMRIEAAMYDAKVSLRARYGIINYIVNSKLETCDESDKSLFELYKKIMLSGMMSIGFVGMYEATSAFAHVAFKKQAIAANVISYMHTVIEKFSEEWDNNYGGYCLEAMKDDSKYDYMCLQDRHFALQRGLSITNRRYYSNYCDTMVGHEINHFKKVVYEQPMHDMCYSHITYYGKRGFQLFTPSLLQESIKNTLDSGIGCLAIVI